ncbi:MAG: hypothetical protein NW214_14675 [Pseudanabaenaceae cyanobacterium bins.39]|nr:hypothetical protein [Pseudanabaenaceae cyanobacterium bins.39]
MSKAQTRIDIPPKALLRSLWAGLGAFITLAIATPLMAQTVSLGRGFRPDPVTLAGMTGGSVSIASIAGINDNCRGFANSSPNHTLTLTDNFPVMDLLVYTSNINDDATLLLKGDNGIVVCADNNAGGLNPQINRRLPRGDYQVWVGSKNANNSFSYTLSISEVRQK